MLLSIFLRDSPDARLAAPAMCLQVVIATTLYLGRLSGLIGAVAATVTFAVLLFPPLGSFYISDPTERTVLITPLFQGHGKVEDLAAARRVN